MSAPSLLNAHQRAVIRADTMIDPIIIDRCTDAYDALLRDDVEAYKTFMGTAIVQMNMPTVRLEDRPTAVDKMKTILIHALADRWGVSFQQTAKRLKRMLSE